MQITREDLNPCTVKLSIVCEPSEVKGAFDRAMKKLAKQLKVPGFRPGHAPKQMLENLMDPKVVQDEAVENLVRDSIKKAINDLEIQPDGQTRPTVSLESVERETSECKFTAKIPLPPVIKFEIADAKGLVIEKQVLGVSEEEIEYQIEELRKKSSVREPLIDRGLQEGDVAVLQITLDSGESRNFMTIVGQTFPTLDEAIISMKVEEMKHLELEFPDNFQEKDWANKKLKVQVTLNSASAVKLPDLTDDFAKTLNMGNVDDLRQKLSDRILEAKDEMARELMIEQAMERLLERAEVQVSDNSWEEIAQRRLSDTAQEAQQQNKSLDDYAKENGMTLEELIKAWEEKAQLYIKRAFLIREIFVAEQMQLTERDLQRELIEMAYENQIPTEEMFDYLKKAGSLEEVRFRAISRKVTDFLLDNADIKEGTLSKGK